MTEFKYLHAADIHLDSPLRGLSRYEGVPAEDVRSATRTALANLTDTAIEEHVAFVIIAGDLYDGDWVDFGTGLAFCAAMGKLAKAEIDVFLLYGNHDAASNMTKKLPLPSNVRIFGTRKPESFVHERTGAVVHGWSYRDRDVRENLAAGYPPAVPNRFNIGVLHTALTGRPPHAPYAPCTVAELTAKGYDYWALGHVHDFEVVSDNPYIIYPGNLQGRNIRETGPKGAVLVTVEEDRIRTSPEHVPLDSVRWARLSVDLSDIQTEAALVERLRNELSRIHSDASHGRPLMIRTVFEGASAMHGHLKRRGAVLREDVRALALAVSDQIWIEKVVVATSNLPSVSPVEHLDETLGVLLETGAVDGELHSELKAELADFVARLPPEIGEGEELFARLRQDDLTELLMDAAATLRIRTMEGQH